MRFFRFESTFLLFVWSAALKMFKRTCHYCRHNVCVTHRRNKKPDVSINNSKKDSPFESIRIITKSSRQHMTHLDTVIHKMKYSRHQKYVDLKNKYCPKPDNNTKQLNRLKSTSLVMNADDNDPTKTVNKSNKFIPRHRL